MTKCEIIEIHRAYNEVECRYVYEVILLFDDKPKLKVGDCEIKQ